MKVLPIHNMQGIRVFRNTWCRLAMACRPACVAAAFLAMAFAPACTKSEISAPGNDNSVSVPILFSATADALPISKALIGPDNLTSEKIVVNDILENNNGDTDHYIDNAVYSYTNGIWQTDETRYWTKTGTHYFTAFIEGQDLKFVQGSDRDSDGLSFDTATLDVQYQPDILYAFAERDMAGHEPTVPVELDFSHVFAAIKINITNVNRPSLSISSYELDNLVSSGKFTVTRGGGLDYVLNSAGKAYSQERADISLDAGETATLYVGQENVDPEGRLLVWPQELGDNLELSFSYSDNGGFDKAKVRLKTTDIVRWNAGFCYVYNITMSDNNINFTVSIVPWKINDVIIER